MIARVWHGWTAPDNADRYETLLKTEIFPGILAKRVAGFRHIELFRRDLPAGDDGAGARPGEVEFVTVMWFDTLDAVRAFAGEDYETAYVPAAARQVLARFDARSAHYDIRAQEDAA
ncbi:MAG: antibiotic biosynthesis monooxygenase [Rhodospirillaceae bacterium]|nr:antibiotic biosynthesis monooxygenase [Rhodospirillaceae bacterium]